MRGIIIGASRAGGELHCEAFRMAGATIVGFVEINLQQAKQTVR
jgi:hypothetical protein